MAFFVGKITGKNGFFWVLKFLKKNVELRGNEKQSFLKIYNSEDIDFSAQNNKKNEEHRFFPDSDSTPHPSQSMK